MQLRLTAEEEAVFTGQFERILERAEQLQHVDIEGVESTVSVLSAFNIVRDDTPQTGLGRDTVLSLAPQQANSLVIVPNVFD